MVSVYRNPLPDREFARFSGFYMAGGGDRMDIPVMNVSDDDMLQAAPPVGKVDCAVDDPNKKIRKPYTITKSRESWSELEHDKFLEALHLFDRDWKKIEAFVVSKTIIQIRSHAQKYFLKVQKNGTSEHVPPPRPKRKAVHPYPQKASKKVVSQATCPSLSSASLLEPGYAVRSDALSIPMNLNGGEPLSSWTCNVVPTVCLSHISKDDRSLASATNNYSSSSSESTPRVWASNDTCRDVNRFNTRRVMPDFAQVYSFIGSVFDLNATDHLKRLRKMDPIDVEAVLMLMNNLCVNLASPQFEDHMRLLSLYNAGNGNDSMGSEIPSL